MEQTGFDHHLGFGCKKSSDLAVFLSGMIEKPSDKEVNEFNRVDLTHFRIGAQQVTGKADFW